MSLLNADSPNEETQPVAQAKVIHCNSCGTDYYTLLQAGQSVSDLLKDMTCPCGNSQLVEKEPETIPNESTAE